MAKFYSEITPALQTFIEAQKLFFVATADADSRINMSPKGVDSLRVVSPTRVLWMNLSGSGNETAAHVRVDSRMTLMFCAFEGKSKILRLYGTAKVIHPRDDAWDELSALFPPNDASRQLFDFSVESLQTSCGFGVPLYAYQGDRDLMDVWAERKGGKAGVERYWDERNRLSIDGKPTGIIED